MTTLRLVPDRDDDIDDSMAANPEDPRDDLGGYGKPEQHNAGPAVTLEPRGKRRAGAPTHWAIVERDGAGPAQVAAGRICRSCGAASSVLVQHPRRNDWQRDTCPNCAGIARRGML